MKRSLRSTVILLVATINIVVFGAGYLWLGQTFADLEAEAEMEALRQLETRIETSIISAEEVRAGGILSWDRWSEFADAIVVRLDPAWDVDSLRLGIGDPRGVRLNPLGCAHRRPDFDERGVLSDIATAVASAGIVRSERGVALPVYDPSNHIWGGCWYEPRESNPFGRLFRQLVPWFLVSTVLLTLTVVLMLRPLVLDPVRSLAEGTARLASGELGTRVRVPDRENELALLVRSFNSMAHELERYNSRLAREVAIATSKARQAEAAAMTQRRLAATGELAAGIAHEINNPLGGMLNAIEVLERKELSGERRREYLGLVRGGLERIGKTVGQVLRLAPRRTHTEPHSIRRPISDAFGLVRHRARQEGVLLEIGPLIGPLAEVDAPGAYDFLDALPEVEGESSEIGSALLNLLVNALDAIAEAGAEAHGYWIRLRIGRSGDELKLELLDGGRGVPPDLLDRASDIFFTTKESGKGTGLGLSIVQNVIDGHGGRVLLSNEPEAGLRVELFLPIARGASWAGTAAAEIPVDPREPSASAGGASVPPTERGAGPPDEREASATSRDSAVGDDVAKRVDSAPHADTTTGDEAARGGEPPPRDEPARGAEEAARDETAMDDDTTADARRPAPADPSASDSGSPDADFERGPRSREDDA